MPVPFIWQNELNNFVINKDLCFFLDDKIQATRLKLLVQMQMGQDQIAHSIFHVQFLGHQRGAPIVQRLNLVLVSSDE